jgi:LCP family protein required for cell wall assembly
VRSLVSSSAVTDRPRVKYRRTWPQRFTLLGFAGVIVASLYTASSVHTVYNDVASIQRIAVDAGTLTDPAQLTTGQPRNILILGTTENDGLDPNDPLVAGRSDALLSDTMMVLRVEPDTGQAYVMSINRDIYVPSIRNKINAAVALGGIGHAVRVITEFLNIPIDDFMIVNFSGFRKVVDELGGVPVYFPYTARDLGSFFDALPGCHVLGGDEALNYVRSRHYEQLINGRWVPDNGNDYTRAERQRDFLVLVLDRAVQKGARNPTVLKNLLGTATSSKAITLDTQLTVQQLLDLGRSFANFDPSNLQRTTLPGNGAMIGDASVILLDEQAAQPILDVFRGNGNTLQPDQVTVKVLDARGPITETAKPDALLAGRGFRLSGHIQQSTGPRQDRTVIEYSADQRTAALLLARYLWADPNYQEITGLKQLTVTLGPDYQGVLLVPKPETELQSKFPGVTTSTPTSPPAVGATPPSTPTTADRSPASAPTTTSGISGRPPDGVTCK